MSTSVSHPHLRKPRKIKTPPTHLHHRKKHTHNKQYQPDVDKDTPHSSLMMSPTGSGHNITELLHSGPSATTPQREYSMTFTPEQSEELEKLFEKNKLPNCIKENAESEIARMTNLTEQRVKLMYINVMLTCTEG